MFPLLAMAADFVPVLNWIPLLPSGLHLLSLYFGARERYEVDEVSDPYLKVFVTFGAFVASIFLGILALLSANDALFSKKYETIEEGGSINQAVSYGLTPNAPAKNLSISGEYDDGGPGCIYIQRLNDNTLQVKAYYCEANDESIPMIEFSWDRTVNKFVNENHGYTIDLKNDKTIIVTTLENPPNGLNGDFYLAEKERLFRKKS
jgi:hypothetical protein